MVLARLLRVYRQSAVAADWRYWSETRMRLLFLAAANSCFRGEFLNGCVARATLTCVTIAVLLASAPAAAAVLLLPTPLVADTAPLLVAEALWLTELLLLWVGGNGSDSTGNGRDLNVTQLNQITHLVRLPYLGCVRG